MYALTALLAQKTKAYTEASHKWNRVLLKQVEFGGDVAQFPVDDFRSTKLQKVFDRHIQLQEFVTGELSALREYFPAVSVALQQFPISLLDGCGICKK